MVLLLRDAFNKFDSNTSDALTLTEFTLAWGHLELQGSESEIKHQFDEVDENGNGSIELQEFIRTIRDAVSFQPWITLSSKQKIRNN